MDTGQLTSAPPTPVRPRWVVPGLIAATVFVIIAAAVAVLLVQESDPTHPEAWDPAVVDLVAFVEENRGLEFRHPVTVDFAEREEFIADLGIDEYLPDPDYEAGFLGFFRALGLGSGPADLGNEQETLLTGGVAAFYIPDEDRVVAPAGDLSISERATLVHELTHALQDQHFDVGRSFRTLERDAAFTALIEGDASRIEQLWIDNLPPADQLQLGTEFGESNEDYERDTAGVSSALEAMFSSPYQLGLPMAEILLWSGELDATFETPPFTEEAIFDPVTNLLGDDEKRPWPTIDGPEGEIWEQGQLGPIVLFMMLADVVPLDQALAATYGWGTDAYVSAFVDDRLCITARIETDSRSDLDELSAALDTWAFVDPGNRQLSEVDDGAVIETCDPGPDGPAIGLDAVLAIDAAAAVSWLALGALEDGLAADEAHCTALGTVGSFTLDEMADPTSAWGSEDLWPIYHDNQSACTS